MYHENCTTNACVRVILSRNSDENERSKARKRKKNGIQLQFDSSTSIHNGIKQSSSQAFLGYAYLFDQSQY